MEILLVCQRRRYRKNPNHNREMAERWKQAPQIERTDVRSVGLTATLPPLRAHPS
ncbi:MAG: hypothetical protein ACN6QH_16385 [Pseudomonas sp.]|uniref:hypothetical protein n=1 Tax=Pseudomonas sp. TaxID=306 RepID=UPI003D0ED311